MNGQRGTLSPDEFGSWIDAILALCPDVPTIVQWGAKHASALAAIRDSHPAHYAAARAAYGARLEELRSGQ